MLKTMAECLISPVKEIGKCILTQCVWPPIKSHFDYWWCFDNNIQRLSDEVRELDRQIYDLKQNIEEARVRAEVVRPGVDEWLEANTKKLEEARRILSDNSIPKPCNLRSRYSLGKNAKKTAEEIAKLRNDGNFSRISYPAPPAAMASPPPTSTMNFESRKGIEDKIIDSLKQISVGIIGICGMGGVGKTTMAERIRERVKEDDLFDEVVMVPVSQTIDMLKIQKEIAQMLGMKLDEESNSARADSLRRRLMDSKRKIIILDDVWDPSLKFEDLGIHIESNFERCKVLLTSRSRDTCKRFKNKMVFYLKILEEEEAWILFKEKACKCDEDPAVHSLAKEVAKECKGLPIALVTVGLAVQDMDVHIWENALSQLKKANPEDFSDVLRHVYNPLKLSYDFLCYDFSNEKSLEKVQYLFLLCCLFPEDFNISVEQLTWYSLGLGLFDGSHSIKEARNRTHTWVGKLENRFLLIDVEKDGKKALEVKMHDVIRDVAIYIGSIEKDGFLKSLTSIENSSDVNCNWMSVDISNEQMEVPVLSRFPKLRLLMLLTLRSNNFFNKFYDISDISFEGMEALNVLSFENISSRSLPPTLGSLKNLQTLRLFRCEVENISVTGKLTSLKILICCKCENIMELPAEIGRLKDLRLLELNGCSKLQKIPFGILSSLSLLEELKIRGSFSEWETVGESRNASLTELESLRHLTCLEIEISDCTLSAQEIRLSQKLVRYRINIPAKIYLDFGDRDYEKVMDLKLPGAVGNWIQLLARNVESLTLRGDGSGNINLAEMGILRSLYISDCSTVKKLVDTSYLNQNDSFCNLKSIRIWNCDNLRYLFSVSAARRCLLQLEVLEIYICKAIEQVFSNEGTDDNTNGCIEFPKLKELTLVTLPNLTAFCQGLENIIIKFPNLTKMSIHSLPKLNSLFPLNSETVENTCFHLFCNPQDVSFLNLRSIHITRCLNLRYLFSVSAARRCLLQLEVLQIEYCTAIEQVFSNEGTDNNTYGCIEFPKLKKLSLKNLPNLTAFLQGLENIIIKFPNLIEMWITELPKLNSLFRPNSKGFSFCNLRSIDIFGCHNLRYLFSVSAAKRTRLLQLELLRIKDCKAMEQVFRNEGTDDNTDGCIEFPKLKELTLENLSNLTAFCQRLENIIIKFPNLTLMEIRNSPKLNSIFPLNPNVLLQLEILRIENCVSMEQVFWNEGTDDNTDGCIEFPKLKQLTLHYLPNLTSFCQGRENIIIKFPNLTKMCIEHLPKLNRLSPLNSETVVLHDRNTGFHLFCNPKVEMDLLKDLTLSGFKDNIKNIWCHQIPNKFFNNLETLQIHCMHGIRSLMTASIAKNLVRLKSLHIRDCEEMVEVIEVDDDNDKQGVDIICLFPNLNSLGIIDMPKLIRFWQWNHALELPLLETMSIENCPAMKTFTLGFIYTPNIIKVFLNNNFIVGYKDLNDVIRQVGIMMYNAFESYGIEEHMRSVMKSEEHGIEEYMRLRMEELKMCMMFRG